MAAPKTIAILTGGGDVPGLNACIKQLVIRAAQANFSVLGIRRGWHGLLACHPEDDASRTTCLQSLTPEGVRTIDRSGGTILHTSRTNPSAVAYADAPAFLRSGYTSESEKMDFSDHVIANLTHLGIDAVIPIGGDDTLSFAVRLHQEGVPVVAIPKTMDNDVMGTDYCIGFSTAVTRSVDFIHALRTSSGSHERIAVVELFGRYCGETSLISAYLAGADRAVISEVPFEPQRLADLLLDDRNRNPSRYAMLTISEGATAIGGEMLLRGEADAFGHRKLGGIGAWTAEVLKQLTGIGMIYQPLFYLMRSGSPDSLDLMVARNFANLAIDLVSRGETGRMTALRSGCYRDVPLNDAGKGAKRVDVEAFYDTQAYRPDIREVAGKPMFLY